ncbi:MAG: homoserine kinase [Clostridia bacterium]|nr:homoserine kinase [Clostridia bacterium]
MKVTVRVPATSANIGPGFDSLGIAFSLYNTFEFTYMESGISFSGCDKKYQNEYNLCYVAYKKVAESAGKNIGGVHIAFSCDIPVARGLGSSATLIAAGAVAANKILGCGFSKFELAKICTPIEGHADNITPAIFGGFTASMMHEGHLYTLSYPVSEKLKFFALIPDFEVKTSVARSVLPKAYSRADVVYNISHVAFLIKALETGNMNTLIPALTDKIHQPYRTDLIHGYAEAQCAAKRAGAPVFFISGSGSTCMCISDKDISEELEKNFKELPNSWKVYPLTVDKYGAMII